jgi:hypothetical protein
MINNFQSKPLISIINCLLFCVWCVMMSVLDSRAHELFPMRQKGPRPMWSSMLHHSGCGTDGRLLLVAELKITDAKLLQDLKVLALRLGCIPGGQCSASLVPRTRASTPHSPRPFRKRVRTE